MEGTSFGRYQLIELLGRGGMGEVWRAHDTAIERDVAVKMLLPHFAQDKTFEQRFRREARAAARLEEPHVVPIYDVGEIDGRLFVTMRLVTGRDLQTRLDEGPLEPELAVSIIEQIGSALNAAHKVGLVHRDVKPSNILVTEDNFAYLIDFGIARAAGETGLTSTGATIGTWSYMAPERFQSGQIEPSSDVYALACVLYQNLTGQLPFQGTTLEQIAVAHMVTPPPRPSLNQPGVPAELDAVVAKGMAKDPSLRYATTLEFARAARAALTGNAVTPHLTVQDPERTEQAPVSPAAPTQMRGPTDPTQHRSGLKTPPPNQEPPTRGVRNKRLLWGGIAAAVGVIAAVVILVMVMTHPKNSASTAASSSGPPPNTGPLTGTYAADFGPAVDFRGKPLEDALPPFKETWRLRSVCGSNGCVATAATGGQFPAKDVVFDDVNRNWVAVNVTPAKCGNAEGEQFDIVSLEPRPDGSLSGEWITENTKVCYTKRTVTFTRIGDTDIRSLPDPSNQPPRVKSPAEALHGRYNVSTTFANGGQTRDIEWIYQTNCLRSGERCITYAMPSTPIEWFGQVSDRGSARVFENGKWTRNDEYDAPCSGGGIAHLVDTSEALLPQPLQDPITVLVGNGHRAYIGNSACSGSDSDYQTKAVRVGD